MFQPPLVDPARIVDELFGRSPVLPPPAPQPVREPSYWRPRQVVRQISRKLVDDEVALLPRRVVPDIERIDRAPDYVPPFDLRQRRLVGVEQTAAPSPPALLPERPSPLPDEPDLRLPAMEPGRRDDELTPPVGELAGLTDEGKEVDRPERLSLDAYLTAGATVYRRGPDRDRVYFRLEIVPRGERELPVIPKDVILLQDASASLAEQRMFFCRQGLLEALDLLSPSDRFVVMSFADTIESSFDGWRAVDGESLGKAGQFIKDLRAEGSTDLYASMREILALPREAGRPVVALVITDGHPTVGLTASTDIIGEFSNLNNGAVSVYTLATQANANMYLLDMLSYGNRGKSTMISGGRWSLPDYIVQKMRQISRPLLDNVRFSFETASGTEVFPELGENLYADQPLVFYGSCPADLGKLVFQVRGTTPRGPADTLFVLDLARAEETRDGGLRQTWARRKLYCLAARYARTGDSSIPRAMRRIRRRYRVDFPYADDL